MPYLVHGTDAFLSGPSGPVKLAKPTEKKAAEKKATSPSTEKKAVPKAEKKAAPKPKAAAPKVRSVRPSCSMMPVLIFSLRRRRP